MSRLTAGPGVLPDAVEPLSPMKRSLEMGAIADAIVAYMQPLLDQTDGSEEQLNKAAAIGQLCYNLALLPEDSRETTLGEMRASLGMNDEEFDEFRRSIVVPMIQRHEAMFPGLHRRGFTDPARVPLPCRPPRERRGPAKSIPEPIVTHPVPAAAAKSTSSVVARAAADSRPRARTGGQGLAPPSWSPYHDESPQVARCRRRPPP